MGHASQLLCKLTVILTVAIVVNLLDCMPADAAVEARASLNKAYAVFVISYNDTTAVGGVAGTAFFVSPKKAITAYHVLQPVSFQLQPGFARKRVWLVHEGEPAIELFEKDIAFDTNNDLTSIHIRSEVQTKFVYESGFDSKSVVGEAIETEGFRANTAGPRLMRVGKEIEIMDVPTLDRIHLEGSLLAHSRVELQATDVKLNQTDCVQVSYQPIRGMSGGPLVSKGRVIGVNSFADPRTLSSTWAVVATPENSQIFNEAITSPKTN